MGQTARQRAASLRNLAAARAHHRGQHPSHRKSGHASLAGQAHATPKTHLAKVRQATSPIRVRVKHLARTTLHL